MKRNQARKVVVVVWPVERRVVRVFLVLADHPTGARRVSQARPASSPSALMALKFPAHQLLDCKVARFRQRSER